MSRYRLNARANIRRDAAAAVHRAGGRSATGADDRAQRAAAAVERASENYWDPENPCPDISRPDPPGGGNDGETTPPGGPHEGSEFLLEYPSRVIIEEIDQGLRYVTMVPNSFFVNRESYYTSDDGPPTAAEFMRLHPEILQVNAVDHLRYQMGMMWSYEDNYHQEYMISEFHESLEFDYPALIGNPARWVMTRPADDAQLDLLNVPSIGYLPPRQGSLDHFNPKIFYRAFFPKEENDIVRQQTGMSSTGNAITKQNTFYVTFSPRLLEAFYNNLPEVNFDEWPRPNSADEKIFINYISNYVFGLSQFSETQYQPPDLQVGEPIFWLPLNSIYNANGQPVHRQWRATAGPFYDYTYSNPIPFHKRETLLMDTPNLVQADVEVTVKNIQAQDTGRPPNYYRFAREERDLDIRFALPRWRGQGIAGENDPNRELPMSQRTLIDGINIQNLAEVGSLFRPDSCYRDEVLKFDAIAVKEMNDLGEGYKEMFERYTEITFTMPDAPIAEIFNKYEMDKHILELITSESEEKVPYKVSQILTDRTDSQIRHPHATQHLIVDANNRYRADRQTFVYDIHRWLDQLPNFEKFLEIDIREYPMLFSGYRKTGLLFPDRESMYFLENIKRVLFSAEMNSFIRHRGRSFADIALGRKAYSNIVAFRISRHVVLEDGSTESEPDLQVLVSNTENFSEFKYIDTQIETYTTYEYRVNAISYVVGSRYSYGTDFFPEWSTNPGQPEGTPFLNHSTFGQLARDAQTVLKLDSWSTMQPALIESPYFLKRVMIVDSPPKAPQVNFLPYQGEDQRVRIFFSTNTGEEYAHPQAIFEDDQEIIQSMQLLQEPDSAGRILYKEDSSVEEFEIIRIDFPPTSVESFELSTHRRFVRANHKTAFFDEIIEPNKEYYYIFRARDRFGLSNPTEVYRFRMVSYASGIFMDMSPYEYSKDSDILREQISFQRLIRIVPSAINRGYSFWHRPGTDRGAFTRELDPTEREFFRSAPNHHGIILGPMIDRQNPENRKKNIWFQKYKMRITSLSSGRSIDMDFNFKFYRSSIERGETIINDRVHSTTACEDE